MAIPIQANPHYYVGVNVGLYMASNGSNRLTALKVKKANAKGRYPDGNCLYLVVGDSGAKHWLLRIVVRGKRRDMGLGSASLVDLEEARDLARRYRKIAREGGDPAQERRGLFVSVKDAALKVHALNAPSWSNEKHSDQWISSLERHVFPMIGDTAISEVTSSDILRVLSPIWVEKSDTAKKIRQRLRMVIKWAKAQGYYEGEDPVELAEQALLRIKPSGEHFKSASYEELPQIVNQLQSSQVSLPTRLALEFLILSACRTTEVLEAHWSEIKLDKRLWVIPAERMKASKPHEVPLTDRMMDLLEVAGSLKLDNGLIFPSQINGKALSNNTLRLALQKRLKVDATVHGMRSAFKDWAAETTGYANEVSEMALGHAISSKVEAAYRRGNLLTKRKQMMADWADYVAGKQNKVISLHPNKEQA